MRTAKVTEVDKVYLSNREAMKYLDMSRGQIQRLRDSAKIPYIKIGKHILYRKADIDRAVERYKITT